MSGTACEAICKRDETDFARKSYGRYGSHRDGETCFQYHTLFSGIDTLLLVFDIAAPSGRTKDQDLATAATTTTPSVHKHSDKPRFGRQTLTQLSLPEIRPEGCHGTSCEHPRRLCHIVQRLGARPNCFASHNATEEDLQRSTRPS